MRTLSLCLALILTIALATAAVAQTGTTTSLSGTVTSWVGGTLVVTTDGGERMTFTTDAQTLLPTSLPVGSRVRVEYSTIDNGMLQASNVTMIPAPASVTPTEETITEDELPQTASPLPLLGITGLLTLGAAILLRRASRRSA